MKQNSAFEPEQRMSFEEATAFFATELTEAVTTGTYVNAEGKTVTAASGAAAGSSVIRSSRLVNGIHRALATSFHDTGLLGPGVIRYEQEVPTIRGPKRQDVVLTPKSFGGRPNEQILPVAIKSCVMSLGNNVDNRVSPLVSEPANFHRLYPRGAFGYVQVIPVKQLNRPAALDNRVLWERVPALPREIRNFAISNGRPSTRQNYDLAERVGLLIVDPSGQEPRIFQRTEELVEEGYLSRKDVKDYKLNIEAMDISTFAQDLLDIHRHRFPDAQWV